jgi:hypothetical protein
MAMLDHRSTFIHNENIRDFQRRLEAETDSCKREQLEKLISEAKANKLPGDALEQPQFPSEHKPVAAK